MADASQQVTRSLLIEFENHSILKPSDDNTALDTLLDQVVAWSTALAPLRAHRDGPDTGCVRVR